MQLTLNLKKCSAFSCPMVAAKRVLSGETPGVLTNTAIATFMTSLDLFKQQFKHNIPMHKGCFDPSLSLIFSRTTD